MQSRTRPRRHLLAYLVPVVVLAIGLNLPKAFESTLVEIKVGLPLNGRPRPDSWRAMQ